MAELTWQSLKDRTAFTLDDTSQAYTDGSVWVTESTGAWLLIRLNDTHTLGEYHAWSEPGGYIPTGLASSLSTSGIEETFNAMEMFAQTNTERMYVCLAVRNRTHLTIRLQTIVTGLKATYGYPHESG